MCVGRVKVASFDQFSTIDDWFDDIIKFQPLTHNILKVTKEMLYKGNF